MRYSAPRKTELGPLLLICTVHFLSRTSLVAHRALGSKHTKTKNPTTEAKENPNISKEIMAGARPWYHQSVRYSGIKVGDHHRGEDCESSTKGHILSTTNMGERET